MPPFRITEYFCVLCQDAIPADVLLDTKLFVFSSKADFTPLGRCQISTTTRQEGSLVHGTCLKEVRRVLLGLNKPVSILRGLRTLHETSRYLWPVPQGARNFRAREVASRAFADSVKNSRATSSLHDSLQKLPPELLRSIGQLAYPSAITAACVLRKTAIAIASTTSREQHSRTLTPSNKGLRSAYRTTLYHTYVSEVEEAEATREDVGEALVVSYDDTACTSVRGAHQSAARTASWYRKICKGPHSSLIVSYKVR